MKGEVISDRILKSIKRSDGLSNIHVAVDGEEHCICGLDDKTDPIEFIKSQKQSQLKEELIRVKEDIKNWKGQEVMMDDKGKVVISQKDIDDRLLELYGKKEVLTAKVVSK